MRAVVVVALMMMAALSVASASDVIELKDSDFESRIGSYDIALVEFYAPWCGHCKRLAPEYEKAATALKNDDLPVALVKVDCTAETKTCGKYGVNGYPTLKIFKSGEFSAEYNGPREADGIVKYMRTKAGPSSRELKTVAEIEKFLDHVDQSIIGFFKSTDSDLAKEFLKTADQLAEKYRFAHTTSAELLTKFKHQDEIVIFQAPRLQIKLEATEKVYSGPAQLNKIKQFIQDEYHGLVGHRTLTNQDQFKRPLVVVAYKVDYLKDVKGSNYVRNRVFKVAQKLRDEKIDVTFAISNSEEFRHELEEFGHTQVNPDGKYVIGRGRNEEKYKFEGEYTPENLEQFARDLVAGRLEVHLKSEPIPTENPDAVRTVVAKNFDEIVNDDSKDVLIEFYAPWCGHCKSLAPKYEELAKKLKNEDDIIIAKMDATANDVPPTYDVKGFPTIYFAPKNAKNSPRKYEAGREVDDFIKYLAKEATNPLKGWDRNGKKTTKSDL
jgi:protein disulfide isomerase family A protein 3